MKKTGKKFFSIIMTALLVLATTVSAFALMENVSTINTDRTGSFDIYKYDITNAEKDGVWDSSYVSTGVRDPGVEDILGSDTRKSSLNANGEVNGYAIKGVEFTYLKVADIRTYTEDDNGASHVEVLYGITQNGANNTFLSAIGVSAGDRYTPADSEDGTMYFYRSDTLINGLKSALASNAITVKNALERFVRENGGTAMPLTDSYGHTSASDLPLGLYLLVETKVPEMVTETTAPFFLSLPMTSVTGSNADDGGERWIYDVTVYPKNLTGIPTLEKTVREALADTGKNDSFAHTATASANDTMEYQILSTLPSITSEATYLTDYSFVDTLDAGLSYCKNDVKIEFFRSSSCTEDDRITVWNEGDGKFSVSYNDTPGMTISMTAAGLAEINGSYAVYARSDMINSGYSDCTVRITYSAKLNPDKSLVCGDDGNSNNVVLVWKRTNSSYYDTLVDDCHVHSYGLDLTKEFSDGQGDFSKVEFLLYNDTDGYFVTAELDESEGIYYVTGHMPGRNDATRFAPTADGSILVKGLEDDTYVATEIQTANGYTLLRDDIQIVIEAAESDALCDIYGTDALGVLQNDPRYADVPEGLYKNMPQKHLEHYLLTASAKVDSNTVTMEADGESANAVVPLTVVNTRGFNLPQTGGHGTWMYGAAGTVLMVAAAIILVSARRKKLGK